MKSITHLLVEQTPEADSDEEVITAGSIARSLMKELPPRL